MLRTNSVISYKVKTLYNPISSYNAILNNVTSGINNNTTMTNRQEQIIYFYFFL